VTDLPPSVETRLANLESRVLALETRLGTTPSVSASDAHDDSEAWLDEVADLARRGDRDGAVALYLTNMAGSDQVEAASFVDDLIRNPPGAR